MTQLVFLKEGDVIYVQGSGKKPYEIKRSGGIVFCSCPAWKNMGGGIDSRVCKHIRANVDPSCLLPQALTPPSSAVPSTPSVRLTKTGKVSTAVGGAVKKETAPPCLLAHPWDLRDPTGWWISLKLDGCVESGTLIDTLERGKIPIDEVVRSKLSLRVKSLNHETGEIEYNQVSSWSELPSNDDWYEILADGERLVVTGDHEIYVPELGVYRKVCELQPGDSLLLDE